MDMVICDVSAWQYWRTPPVVRDADLLPGELTGERLAQAAELLGISPATLAGRTNARDADRAVCTRLYGDLQGVEAPVHVMVPAGSSMHHSSLVVPHLLPEWLGPEQVVSLGNGLAVLSPEVTLLYGTRRRGAVAVAKMMFEACGLYALFHPTPRARLTIGHLAENGTFEQLVRDAAPIYGYSDEQGRPLGAYGPLGEPFEWIPYVEDDGTPDDMWKRPPLTSVARLHEAAAAIGERRGMADGLRALKMTSNGSASPAETMANLLLCSGTWCGGESWGKPDLNRQIDYTDVAKRLSHRQFAIGDAVWADRRCVLEVASLTHHGEDYRRLADARRRAALESMGYTVGELMPEQLADLSLLDASLPSLAERFGFELQARTPAFLKRRRALYDALVKRDW